MSEQSPSELTTRLTRETQTYLDRLTEALELLDELVARQAAGRSFDRTVDRIAQLESECDRSQQQLSKLATTEDTDPYLRLERMYLNSPYLVELYQQLDEIANTIEQIANELQAAGAALSPVSLMRFQEMTDWLTEAMDGLRQAFYTFTTLLCASDQDGTIVDEIRLIRTAEGACDEIRNEAIAAAFDDPGATHPTLDRDLAHLFDQVADTIEDIADRLIVIASTKPWLQARSDTEDQAGV